MAHSVRRHLRVDVEAYDATIRRFIPGYEEMLEVSAGAVASVRPSLVVDLGAGTGALAAAVLRHPEVGRVRLLDIDPEMLERARERLRGQRHRVELTLGSYDGPFPPADAVAASLALHHIPAIGAKRQLFARAFAALRPGGVLVNADATMPADAPGRQALFRVWADHLVASGIAEERAWQHFAEWSEEDTYLPLEEELAALREVGFRASCIWRRGPMSVVVGRRP